MSKKHQNSHEGCILTCLCLTTTSHRSLTLAHTSWILHWLTWMLSGWSSPSCMMKDSVPSTPSTWMKQCVVWPIPLGRILCFNIALITVLFPLDVLERTHSLHYCTCCSMVLLEHGHFFQNCHNNMNKPSTWAILVSSTTYDLCFGYEIGELSYSADSRFAPSQWETALLCNDVLRGLPRITPVILSFKENKPFMIQTYLPKNATFMRSRDSISRILRTFTA